MTRVGWLPGIIVSPVLRWIARWLRRQDSKTVWIRIQPRPRSIWSTTCQISTLNTPALSRPRFPQPSGAALVRRTTSSSPKVFFDETGGCRESRMLSLFPRFARQCHPVPRLFLSLPLKRRAGDSRCLTGLAVASPSSSFSEPIWRMLPKLKYRMNAVRVWRVVCAVDLWQ